MSKEQASSHLKMVAFQTEKIDGVPKVLPGPPKKGTREHEQRVREVDDLYDMYLDTMSIPKVISHLEFERFKPLFCAKNLEGINPMDESQTAPFRELSEELLTKIDKYREFHVRQADGTYHTYPPIYTPVALLDNDRNDALDIFKNLLEKCGDQPWKRSEATANFIDALYKSQNPEIVMAQSRKFIKIATKLHTEVINKSKVKTTATQEAKVTPIKEKAPDKGIIDDMEFVLD